MADKWNSDQDDAVRRGPDEEIRGVADDEEEFDPAEDLDEEEDEEEGSTF